jgi:DNA-binding GntR family transcriptional regulator
MTDATAANGYDVVELRGLVTRLRERHETAQELALAALREGILEGILPPGTRLRQEDLAAVFDTSRIPIREALRVLEYEGLVASEPHRGFTVTGLDADQIEEIYDLRAVLEGHAVRLAIPLLTQTDIDELDGLFDRMQAAEDDDERLALREQFYLRLYSVTARPRLVGLIARLRHEVARSLRWKTVSHSPDHHAVFFAAIKAGDADAAENELVSHYQKVVALLRRFLRESKLEARSIQQ